MMSLLKTELFLQCFSDQSWRELCLHINSIVFLGTYLRSIFRELFFYEISVVYFCDSGYVLLFSEKKKCFLDPRYWTYQLTLTNLKHKMSLRQILTHLFPMHPFSYPMKTLEHHKIL